MAERAGGFPIADGQTVVFIGDSITDSARCGGAKPLGDGYVRQIAQLIAARYPERRIAYHNKGIGGQTIVDLCSRWGDDVVAMDPDWLSVLVGVNDIHRQFNADQFDVSPDRFREHYRACLQRTAEETESRIILMDPFYISVEAHPDSQRTLILNQIAEYIAVVRELADEFDTLHVAMHDVFQRQLQYNPPDLFAADAMHPNVAGQAVIAEAWLSAVGW